MRFGSIFMALVGLGVAGGSVYTARHYLEISDADLVQAGKPAVVSVLAAAQDIPFGHPIEAHMLTTISWPAESVPAGTFTDVLNVLPEPGNPPRRAKRALAQGELLLRSKLSDFGEKVTIVQTLAENTRAMAIKVDAETAVGGFVTPGDFVDVVLTQGRNEDLRAVTILQNVRVIGVDQTADEEMDKPMLYRTVTVEVTPEQSQRLALAQRAGTLSLSLRSLENISDEPLDSLRLSDLLREKSPVSEAETPSATIKVRRGTEPVQEVEVN